MCAAASKLEPTLLDPIGSVIYYVCVTEAIKSGTWTVPSSQKISEMLEVHGKKPLDAQVDCLWRDLGWMIDAGLLLSEHSPSDADYRKSFEPHSLTQVNVNKRLQKLSPAFKQPTEEEQPQQEQKHHRQRHMDEREIVEKRITAVRLVAFKDLYISNDQHVPQKLLLEFLSKQGLAASDEYYGEGGFLPVMHRIKYLDFPGLPRNEEFSDMHKDKPLLVVPGTVFRYQDMYLELRALDYFSEQRSDIDRRRTRRKELRKSAERFATERRRRPRPTT
jgi:hypothetical protein